MEWVAIILALVALYRIHSLEQQIRSADGRATTAVYAPSEATPVTPGMSGLESNEPRPAAVPSGSLGGTAEKRATAIAVGAASPVAGPPPPPPPPPRPKAERGGEGVRTASRSAGDAAGKPQPAIQSRSGDIESFVGGRVLLVVGVVVIFLGLGFFLHTAIRRGVIGPGMRTILTALVGGLALTGGEYLRRRALDVFAAGLSGAGMGALFLATHFAANVHGFVSKPTGFMMAAVITAAGVLLGASRRSPFLTHLGFLGGWFAPVLFGAATDSVWPLAGWLLLMDAGVLAIRMRLPYAGLDLMAAIASSVYLGSFVFSMGPDAPLLPVVLAWAALSTSRIAIAVVPALALRTSPPWKALAAATGGAMATVFNGAALMIDDHRVGLGLAMLVFVGLYLAAAWASRRRLDDFERAARGYAAIAITLLAAAIPLIFPEIARAPVYAIAAVAFFVIGSEERRIVPRLGGYAYLMLSVTVALDHSWPMHEEGFRLVWNRDFMTLVIPAIGILVSGLVRGRIRADGTKTPTPSVTARPRWEASALSVLGTVAIAVVCAWEFGLFVHLGDRGFLGLERQIEAAASGWVLVLCGIIAQRAWLRFEPTLAPVGAVLCALGALRALPAVELGSRAGDPVLLNPAFLVGVVVAVGLFVCAWAARGMVRRVMWVAFPLWVLAVLTLDAQSLGRSGALLEMSREDLRFLSLVAVSVVWAANGAAWAWVGFLRELRVARLAGIGLLAITAAKVFVVDLSDLDTAWRAGSFLGLGVLSLAVSYLYHRKGSLGARTQEADQRPAGDMGAA